MAKASAARHHAEWLSLVEVSGPFLSMPVLLRVFRQGLEAHDPEILKSLRIAYGEWEASQNDDSCDDSIHQAWVRFVLKTTLGLVDEVLQDTPDIPQSLRVPVPVPEQDEILAPDLIVKNPLSHTNAGRTRMLVQVYGARQELTKPVSGKRWKASPATRMTELIRQAPDVRLGLVTNGEQWMLVDAPKDGTTGYASWYAHLWLEEERVYLQSFRSLLGVEQFFNVSDADTLEAMLAESVKDQQDVTDQLGYQVRRAVELLVECLDRADRAEKGQLLAGVPEAELYEAALTVMMRLVFLFSAEERELLLLGDPLFDDHYAVSTLREQLRETADQYGEEILERRYDAYYRLLSTFRAVFAGIEHDRMTLPAYGGRLFDPDRFPFLEGRKKGTFWKTTSAAPLPVNNRTVLHLLEALQMLQIRVAGGGPAEARRLSFRALDIEQIGHVYEGLLDHTAVRATEPVLSLAGSKDKEPEIALSELEKLEAQGRDGLIAFLTKATGRSVKALQKAMTSGIDESEVDRFQAACGSKELSNRVRPFAMLVRRDSFGYPVVIREGSVYVTAGTDRRTSGTHYTPRSLTEPIVQHTLEPLIYAGPADGKPRKQWKLLSAAEILALNICDMACGSGAFLVQACRYLAERLVEAWEGVEKEHPNDPGVTPEGKKATGDPGETLIPKDPEERSAYAQRLVAQRCLYGVDKNPLAVEMAKLSLWLLTLAKEKPFTFLDHAIRCGDSLIGVHDLEQLRRLSFDTSSPAKWTLPVNMSEIVDEANHLRLKIESAPSAHIEDIEAQMVLLGEVEEKMLRLKCVADILTGCELKEGSAAEKTALRRQAAVSIDDLMKDGDIVALRTAAADALGDRRTFHWSLEFPEVMVERGGFDAFVCNPPFMGGKKITGNMGADYRDHLIDGLADGKRGNADLCAYFFLRAAELLRNGGMFGMLATNTIAQGDTREVGLEQLTENGFTIPRAVQSRKWPGQANLEVSHVWISKGEWRGEHILDDKLAAGITPFLTVPGAVIGKPYRLKSNENKSFIGSYVLGMGFVLQPEEAQSLIEKNSRNKDVLFPYLNGEDLNSRPEQSPSRWVINFFDWPLNRSAEGTWKTAGDQAKKEWLREGKVPDDYPGPVAADYPDCISIVEEKVKPERTRKKDNEEFALRKPLPQKWWIYADKRPKLYSTIAGMERVLVAAQTSKFLCVAFQPKGIVCSHTTVVFPIHSTSGFALLNSTLHYDWVRRYCASLENRLRYLPSDCFETFPFPAEIGVLGQVGETYREHRCSIMLSREEGLTKTYNRFHDPGETSDDISRLRELDIEMDNAVTAAYGWNDLDLGHDFHETKRGIRFTISEEARQEVLGRLLELNHKRYAEEVEMGLHEKGKKGYKKRRKGDRTRSLFVEEL